MPFLINPEHDAAVVGRYVPAFFGAASILALCGNPMQSPALRRTVLTATPAIALLLTWTSYLQGAGARKTFYDSELIVFDALRLTRSAAEILILVTVILLANRRLLPWTLLVATVALYFPLARLFMMLGGNIAFGMVGIQPSTILATCCIASPVAAWVAWKRPRVEIAFQDKEISGS